MSTRNGRLSLALEVQSVVRLVGGRGPEKSEGPAATLSDGSPGVTSTRTRDLPTPHSDEANGSADMAERTRTPGLSDSRTRATAVKITPAMQTGPVTTTPAVA